MRIAAEIFGEDLQLSLLSKNGGLSLVPRRLFEHSSHGEGRKIISVVDFNMPATVALVRRATPCRFDLVLEQLVSTLRDKLGHSTVSA
jgi:hypothetical protein